MPAASEVIVPGSPQTSKRGGFWQFVLFYGVFPWPAAGRAAGLLPMSGNLSKSAKREREKSSNHQQTSRTPYERLAFLLFAPWGCYGDIAVAHMAAKFTVWQVSHLISFFSLCGRRKGALCPSLTPFLPTLLRPILLRPNYRTSIARRKTAV